MEIVHAVLLFLIDRGFNSVVSESHFHVLLVN